MTFLYCSFLQTLEDASEASTDRTVNGTTFRIQINNLPLMPSLAIHYAVNRRCCFRLFTLSFHSLQPFEQIQFLRTEPPRDHHDIAPGNRLLLEEHSAHPVHPSPCCLPQRCNLQTSIECKASSLQPSQIF